MLVSVCLLHLEPAAFALGDDNATRRTIQTQTDLIRYRSTEHRRRTSGQKTANKRLTRKKELAKKHVTTVSMMD